MGAPRIAIISDHKAHCQGVKKGHHFHCTTFSRRVPPASHGKAIVDTTIDMRYGKGKAPNGYQELPRLPFLQDTAVRNPERPAQPLRVVPVLAVYGQNAGGKSALVEAVRQITAFVHNAGFRTPSLGYLNGYFAGIPFPAL